ncbi:biotin biosynthesis protein BioC [Pararhizobium sp.]|uniref:biotin biosynthesis protein BioC n=1 Tax=Pararhizobium sp. TaxID=1977563 RepID=UPI00271EC620|nr:biotin biosynthesis protein BioC [Pararhizobium sp.]MDO9415354.1 biotin biosynthesis protein BioC [Pararhizobium sp.]
MQVVNIKTGAATGDGLNTLVGRPVVKSGPAAQATDAVARASGLYDPSARISLSVDAMLFLSKSKKAQEKQPALTNDEWNNNTVTAALAGREFNAFGKFAETGDSKAYYRAYIEYFDGLSYQDQNSRRYTGTREAAMAGLRSLEYSDSTDTGEQPAFVPLFGSQKTGAAGAVRTSVTGADDGSTTEAEPSDGLSNIQKLYAEIF